MAAKLRAPFASRQIGKLPKVWCKKCSDKNVRCEDHKSQKCGVCKAYVSTAHLHVDYVGHAHATERLLDVDPDWNWEPLAFNGNGLPAMDEHGGLWIRLTVGGTTRLGYGHADGKRGGDAVKEAIGDAIRNAGMRFGLALNLWKKEAPAPVSDVPERQVERPEQTPVDRANELRGQLAAIAKNRGWDIPKLSDEFALWSQGKDITKESVAVLAEYKDHLQRGAS
ncbi:hypothetical protein [Amycolatopsis palatopharyngis]|uniref:hypothetical protein n=1 Tax=Amycolatopsis palatopharyngis TaxID=187982 RepID=UPI0013BE9530|nr:hypothetical protein [Amycolatopsis palatopharyngis]